MRAAAFLLLLTFVIAFPVAAQPSDWCYNNGDWIFPMVDGSTVTIFHYAAFYNCGPDSITSVWTQEGGLFRINETQYNPQAMCFCCWYLNTRMTNVPAGHYNVDFSWFDYETQQTLHDYFDFLVPDVGQAGDPHRIASSEQVCAAPPGSAPDTHPVTHLLLHPIQPNPFRDTGVIRFELARNSRATLAVYSIAGVRVRTLADGDMQAGAHMAPWDGRDDAGRLLPAGLYFCRLTADGARAQRTLVHLD